MQKKKMEKRLDQIITRMNIIDTTVRRLEERQDTYIAHYGSIDSGTYEQIQALAGERDKLYEEKLWLEGEMVKMI